MHARHSCAHHQGRAAAHRGVIHSRALHSRPFQVLRAAAADGLTTTSTQHGEGLIFPKGAPGSWDEGGVGQPVVRCFVGDNEERWFMWYSGRKCSKLSPVDLVTPSSGSMGVAISKDGLRWQRGVTNVEGTKGEQSAVDVGMSIVPNGDWWTHDTCHVAVSDVQVLSSSSVQSGVGVYWCFYSGGDYSTMQLPTDMPGAAAISSSGEYDDTQIEGMRLRPGLAMSQDAKNWARIEGDHHTGALFDVGEAGQWDELFVGHPQVMSLAPRDMRMYYYSWDKQRKRFVIGNATSPDGFRWSKKGVIYDPVEAGAGPNDHDAMGAASCNVVRDIDNRQYCMFYEAVARDGRRSIGLAVSKDGNKWKRCPKPVLEAQQSSTQTGQGAEGQQGAGAGGVGVWDGGSVGCPCAVSMSAGKWRLYYAGRPSAEPGPWEGIGLALSLDGADTFEKVPTTYRRVPAGTGAAS